MLITTSVEKCVIHSKLIWVSGAMRKAQSDIKRKLRVLKYAKEIGNVSKACQYFGISHEAYYQWKRAYEQPGEKGLINSKPCPENPKVRITPYLMSNSPNAQFMQKLELTIRLHVAVEL